MKEVLNIKLIDVPQVNCFLTLKFYKFPMSGGSLGSSSGTLTFKSVRLFLKKNLSPNTEPTTALLLLVSAEEQSSLQISGSYP